MLHTSVEEQRLASHGRSERMGDDAETRSDLSSSGKNIEGRRQQWLERVRQRDQGKKQAPQRLEGAFQEHPWDDDAETRNALRKTTGEIFERRMVDGEVAWGQGEKHARAFYSVTKHAFPLLSVTTTMFSGIQHMKRCMGNLCRGNSQALGEQRPHNERFSTGENRGKASSKQRVLYTTTIQDKDGSHN